MDQNSDEAVGTPGESWEAEHSRPTVYEYVGVPVLIGYVGGPYLHDIRNPYDIARGQLEARQALFILEEVSDLGITARRILGAEELAPPTFMPWSAIQQIHRLPSSDQLEEKQEQEEQEQEE